MDNVSFAEILDTLLRIAQGFYTITQIILEYLTMPIAELFRLNSAFWTPLGVLGELIIKIIEATPIGNASLLTLFLGGGIGIYIIYQIITWFANLVT